MNVCSGFWCLRTLRATGSVPTIPLQGFLVYTHTHTHTHTHTQSLCLRACRTYVLMTICCLLVLSIYLTHTGGIAALFECSTYLNNGMKACGTRCVYLCHECSLVVHSIRVGCQSLALGLLSSVPLPCWLLPDIELLPFCPD